MRFVIAVSVGVMSESDFRKAVAAQGGIRRSKHKSADGAGRRIWR